MAELYQNPLNVLLAIFLLGGLGAAIRYAVDQTVPHGLVFVNMAGSFLLGMLATWSALPLDSGLGLAIATGFCGGLTTFSTVALQWVLQARQRRWGALIRTVRLHLFSGLISAAGGLFIGSLLG